MAITVQLWSGCEVRALREAKRLSIRDFAGKLGVSQRMVSKWEAGGESIHPRPANQDALDTFLAASSADVHARFAHMTGVSEPSSPVTGHQPATPQQLAAGESNRTRHPVDGKLMTLVDAGVFLAGATDDPIWLPAFYVDVFPTTNSDYARFVTVTGYTPPAYWEHSERPPTHLSDHPVVFVTWLDAAAYASWAVKELPTSQQWEKAARGSRGDTYPWGSQMTPAKCNVREGGIGNTTPVSRYHSGVSAYGVYDLCGNVWEWCSTESAPDRRELKGSAFTSPFFRATPSTFNDASTDMSDDDTGFRCVTPEETIHALLTPKA